MLFPSGLRAPHKISRSREPINSLDFGPKSYRPELSRALAGSLPTVLRLFEIRFPETESWHEQFETRETRN